MSKYTLFYAGYNRTKDVEQIGVATSQDCNTWTLGKSNPIIPVGFSGSGDMLQTSNPCVIKVGDTYKMWYQGKSIDKKIGIFYAESADLISWVNHPGAVFEHIQDSADTGYRVGVQHPHVIYNQSSGEYQMWFSITHNSKTVIEYAQSEDGLQWNVVDSGCVVPEYPWEGCHVLYPMVLKDKEIYRLWYTGRSVGGMWSIGYAESIDGVVWNKHKKPILSVVSLPKIIRRIFEYMCKVIDIEFKIPLHGIASVNIWREGNVFRLLAHEVGTHGRLYIPLYESLDGVQWKKIKQDILSKVDFQEWDTFFQGDPYIYVE